MTLSTMKNRIFRFTNLNSEIIESILQDAYRQLCMMDWNQLNLIRQISTVAPYATGTVTITNTGAVTGSGTTFTSTMTDRYMQVYYDDSFFRVASYVDDTHITLEDWTGLALTTATSYSIFKLIYTLDSSIKLIYDVAYQISLPKKSQSYFNRLDPARSTTGSPTWWAYAGMDATNTPQIEIYPVADDVYPLRVYGKRKISELTDTSTPILSEDLVESYALIQCYRIKQTQQPGAGWDTLLKQQGELYQQLLNDAKEEDAQLVSRRDKVKDYMSMFETYPASDTFWTSHDVE